MGRRKSKNTSGVKWIENEVQPTNQSVTLFSNRKASTETCENINKQMGKIKEKEQSLIKISDYLFCSGPAW